mmetsp:Transcript_37810/g.61780  ORF Transcript_37810/g.61780 Transcript_37810/m.61780 type:complete len:257 (+) Transcript_37810:1297-2067(+)
MCTFIIWAIGYYSQTTIFYPASSSPLPLIDPLLFSLPSWWSSLGRRLTTLRTPFPLHHKSRKFTQIFQRLGAVSTFLIRLRPQMNILIRMLGKTSPIFFLSLIPMEALVPLSPERSVPAHRDHLTVSNAISSYGNLDSPNMPVPTESFDRFLTIEECPPPPLLFAHNLFLHYPLLLSFVEDKPILFVNVALLKFGRVHHFCVRRRSIEIRPCHWGTMPDAMPPSPVMASSLPLQLLLALLLSQREARLSPYRTVKA